MHAVNSVQQTKQRSLWHLPPAPSCAGHFPNLPLAQPPPPPKCDVLPSGHRNLTGKTIGAIYVLKFSHVDPEGHAYWKVRFQSHLGGCAHAVTLPAHMIRSERRHCGCRQKKTGLQDAPPGWRLVTYEGQRKSVAAWAREMQKRGIKITASAIGTRLSRGWSVKKAMTTPGTERRVGVR